MLGSVLFALTLHAAAQDTTGHVDGFTPRPFAGHPVLEVRVGAGTSGPSGHANVCAEVSPIHRLSLEACGNGAGMLHHARVPDMAHFRVRGTVVEKRWGRTSLGALVGAGFAEVSTGVDEPGFLFGAARSREQSSGAGAEGSVSGKARHWVHERAYLVGDVNAGLAWIPSAPVVLDQQGAAVPFFSASVGLGF